MSPWLRLKLQIHSTPFARISPAMSMSMSSDPDYYNFQPRTNSELLMDARMEEEHALQHLHNCQRHLHEYKSMTESNTDLVNKGV